MANACNDGNFETGNYTDVFPESSGDQQTYQTERVDHAVRAIIYGAIFLAFSFGIMAVVSKWIKQIYPSSLNADIIMIVTAIVIILLAIFCSRAWLRKL